MDYKKIYDQIIERAKSRGLNKKALDYYTEKHHIIPRCIGGKDEDNNYVLLTAKEHFLCHKLLILIYPKNGPLNLAVKLMSDTKGITINSREYEEIRKVSSDYLRELNKGENNPMFGKTISEEHKRILSSVNSHKKSLETIEKMRKSQTGKKASEETRKKLSESHTGLKIHTDERKEYLRNKWILNNPNKNRDMSGANNPSSKKVQGPNGTIYSSIKECSESVGKYKGTISNWCKNNKNGYKFL